MGNRPALVGRGLRGSDVHPPVYLHGIDADDLTFEFSGKPHGELALPRCRGTEDGDDRQETTSPMRWCLPAATMSAVRYSPGAHAPGT